MQCAKSRSNKKADPQVGFSYSDRLNYFAGASAGAAGASAAGAASVAAGAAGASAAGAAAGASAAGAAAGASVAAGAAGASSFLLQAVRAIANRDAISRDLVMIYLSNNDVVDCDMAINNYRSLSRVGACLLFRPLLRCDATQAS